MNFIMARKMQVLPEVRTRTAGIYFHAIKYPKVTGIFFSSLKILFYPFLVYFLPYYSFLNYRKPKSLGWRTDIIHNVYFELGKSTKMTMRQKYVLLFIYYHHFILIVVGLLILYHNIMPPSNLKVIKNTTKLIKSI